MASKDYYKTLGVPRNASLEEIKKAFKKRARETHPDCNPGRSKECEEKFKELVEAYEVLSNPEKRQAYDMFGHVGPQAGPGPDWTTGPDGARVYTWTSGSTPDFDLEELLRGTGWEDLFGEIFGKRRKSRSSRRRADWGGLPFRMDLDPEAAAGPDVEADIHISFDEAMRGGVHRFTLNRSGPCPECAGRGRNLRGRQESCSACYGTGKSQLPNISANFVMVCPACGGSGRVYLEPCPACQGRGRAEGQETITVKIPAGVKDGGRMRIAGKGEAGPDGRRGDLYLRIHVAPHPFFRREGDDLHLDIPITVSEAGLGAEVQVPTLEGSAVVKIPAGTQSGAVLRLKGKGAPSPQNRRKGDLHVHIKVIVPTDLSPEARRLFQELRKYEPDPRKGKF